MQYDILRDKYIKSLLNYEGTKYIWGGESKYGIDCSGLIRCGMINTNMKEGIKELNSRLIREALFLWWNDCSAKELGNGYRNKTIQIATAKSINEIDYRLLLPGDFVVTESGVHTLAYIGNQTWIEANPDKMKVIVETNPNYDNNWFNIPVKVMRWKQFDKR